MSRNINLKEDCVKIRISGIMEAFSRPLPFKSNDISGKLSCGVSFKVRVKWEIIKSQFGQQSCLNTNQEKLFWGKRV